MYSLDQIAEITGATMVGRHRHLIRHYLTDSRNLQSAPDTLFVAIKTARNNGHRYIKDLVKQGVRSFLVKDGEVEVAEFPDEVTFLLSEDPLHTLQSLAAYHRQQFNLPVIGITGSNGKTVVKEWLYQLLKHKYSICRSPKSFNSQIGVPLSVLSLNHSHNLAIFEAGISQPGEMERLASIIRPGIGILTSIGAAHDEGFSSREQKISEKLVLLQGSDTLIVNGVTEAVSGSLKKKGTILVGTGEGCDFRYKISDHTLTISSANGVHSFYLPFSDEASASNAATCCALLFQLGYGVEEIASGLQSLQAVALRLEIKNAIHHSLLINDYYNSDLDSLRIALNFQQQQNRRRKKIVILSDIEQSGIPPQSLYRSVADLVNEGKIELLIGIGQEISRHKPLFKPNSLFFADTASFAAQLRQVDYQLADATILLKGARSFGFEEISRLLQQKSHDTVFEINLDHITANVNYYRSLLKKDTGLMCMVKAMGYGSGGAEIARTLQYIGVNYLAVAYADEGVELRQSQVNLPIMVMNPEEDAFDDMLNYRLEPEVYNWRSLRLFTSKTDAAGLSEAFPVHIKIDTGMHRLGFEEKDLAQLANELKHSPQLRVRSVFSHLAASDNPELDEFTNTQIRRFEKAASFLEKELGYTFIKHLCNSAGITRFPQAHYGMVRLGIGLYGIGVNENEQQHLLPAGTLKTRISQIKELEPGETVSYNRSGKISSPSRIATLPIGYADGFSRALGNGRHGVYINGRFCKTVGNVCMDMCMVDVSGINCSEGDEVILFENAAQVATMAKAVQSIPYEILTSVSGRVKRVYVKE